MMGWLASPTPALADPPAEPEGRKVSAQGGDEEELTVTIRGDTSGAYVSRTSVDESAREPIDAASLLAELPSVHVRRLGAEGSLATLSIRGSASSQVGVVLASIPLTSAGDPSFDVGALPLWPGASFRVYRGFAPSSLGTTGHIGGVLAIEPPSASSGERTEWWAAAGSFGSLKLRAGDVREARGITIGTGIFASRSDGDFTFELSDPATGDPTTLTRENARYVSAGGVGRASIELGWGAVGVTILADARRQGLPGTPLFPAATARFDAPVRLDAGRVVAGADVTIRTTRGAWRGAAWGRRETSTLYYSPRREGDPASEAAPLESAVLAGGGSIGWRGRAVEALTIGATFDARAERFVPGEGGDDAGRLAAGLGIDADLRASSALTLSASGRVDARRDSSRVVATTDRRELDDRADDTSEDIAPSGHVGASYRIADAAIVSAHGGALYRPPSFFELFGDNGSLVGDPSLRPERALSADAGLHGAASDGRVELRYELVGFLTYARDLITFIPLGLRTFHARNIEKARIAGAEASVELVARRLRTSLSYTLLATENQSDDPLSSGRSLPGRPLHDLAYDASYRFGPLWARYSLDALAGTTVDTQGTFVLPPRVLHAAGIAIDVPWMRGLRASIDVHNLFNLRSLYVSSPLRGAPKMMPVSDFLGFPLPGRTLWATLRFTGTP